MIKEIISEVKEEMGDNRPEIEIAAQFAAVRMFQRLDKKYNFNAIKEVKRWLNLARIP